MAERVKGRFTLHGILKASLLCQMQVNIDHASLSLLGALLEQPVAWPQVCEFMRGTVHSRWTELAELLFTDGEKETAITSWFRRLVPTSDLVTHLIVGDRGEASRIAHQMGLDRLAVLICCKDSALMAQQLQHWQPHLDRIRPVVRQAVSLLAGNVASAISELSLGWEACLAAFWNHQVASNLDWRGRLAAALLAFEQAMLTDQRIPVPRGDTCYQLLSLMAQADASEAGHQLTLRQGVVRGESLCDPNHLGEPSNLVMAWCAQQLFQPIRPCWDPRAPERIRLACVDQLLLMGRVDLAQRIAPPELSTLLSLKHPSSSDPLAMALMAEHLGHHAEQFQWLVQADHLTEAMQVFSHQLAPDLFLRGDREMLHHYATLLESVDPLDEWSRIVMEYLQQGIVPTEPQGLSLRYRAALSQMRGTLLTRAQWLRSAHEHAQALK